MSEGNGPRIKVNIHGDKVQELTLEQFAMLQDWGNPDAEVPLTKFVALLNDLVDVEVDGAKMRPGQVRIADVKDLFGEIAAAITEVARQKN